MSDNTVIIICQVYLALLMGAAEGAFFWVVLKVIFTYAENWRKKKAAKHIAELEERDRKLREQVRGNILAALAGYEYAEEFIEHHDNYLKANISISIYDWYSSELTYWIYLRTNMIRDDKHPADVLRNAYWDYKQTRDVKAIADRGSIEAGVNLDV